MIAKVDCSLPHPLHLVVSPVRYEKLMTDYMELLPPTEAGLRRELNTLSAFGVPTYLDNWRDGGVRINFFTQRYEIGCSLTSHGDGYHVGHIIPLSLRRHNQIARQSIRLKALEWFIHGTNADLNRHLHSGRGAPQAGFDKIKAAWSKVERLSAQGVEKSYDVSLEHQRFLATMRTLIDLARQVEVDKATRRSSTAVLGLEPVTQETRAGHAYKFLLASSTDLDAGDYVLAGISEPGQRGGEYAGVVKEKKSDAVIIHFYQSVDRDRLRQVEWLIPFASQKQFDIQLQAIQALEEGTVRNDHLLQFIVDGKFQSYRVPHNIELSGERLNRAQRDVIARAEAAPDVLLVLGPPGTGKTHTIRQIVSRQAEQDKRVMITSKNNKAVDNVLEALQGVRAIRIGREEKISEAVRPLMIDEQAQELQRKILAKTAPTLADLADTNALWPQLEQLLEDVSQSAAEWLDADLQLSYKLTDFAGWQRSIYLAIERAIASQEQRLDRLTKQIIIYSQQSRRLSTRLRRIKPLCQTPILGPFFILWADRMYIEWLQVAKEYRTCLREREKFTSRQREVWKAYRRKVTASDEALTRKRPIAAAEEKLNQKQQQTLNHIGELRRVITRLRHNHLPSLPDTVTFLKTVETIGPNFRVWHQELLESMNDQFRVWHQEIVARRHLLSDWHALLEKRRRALYPTLIKGANVIGATYIGIATDANFSDLDFDLVIADEAGQIQVMDLLVPLVRAKRAVLVGDDRQLPPVVEEAVASQISEDQEEQRVWLNSSLFEHLFNENTPESHKTMLDTQYRMPKIIADFISRHFYDNNFHTGKDIPHADPFFRSPMVFIDTQLEKNRWEQPALEPEGIRGYTNYFEARLIADVVLAYQDHGDEWGVIVPYKKQAERIQKELKRRRQALSMDLLKDWVATVDSFQGKERDVIIFGFTRSNSHGRIGFLSELRRLNVSLTRAKQQLVLIGNASTLTRATEESFAALMRSLLKATQSLEGGYFHAKEFQQRLATPPR